MCSPSVSRLNDLCSYKLLILTSQERIKYISLFSEFKECSQISNVYETYTLIKDRFDRLIQIQKSIRENNSSPSIECESNRIIFYIKIYLYKVKILLEDIFTLKPELTDYYSFTPKDFVTSIEGL